MTPVIDAPIAGPLAWTPETTGGKAGLSRDLDAARIRALDALLVSLRDVPTLDITRADFTHPALAPLLADLRAEVMDGKGVVVLRGVSPEAFSREERERIFWGLGQHFGYCAVQSSRGDRIGYVRHEPGDPHARGYRSSGELVLHTDSHAMIALTPLQPAESGGETWLASSATIHNVILRERPDLLAPLYRGSRWHSSEVGLTTGNIPVFSNVAGHLSVMFFEDHIRRGAKTLGEPLPADLDEALTFFASVARRDDVCVKFMLEPGEMLFSNNFVVLHARTEFRNSAEKQRCLARLWINIEPGRPTIPELHERASFYDRRYDPRLIERA